MTTPRPTPEQIATYMAQHEINWPTTYTKEGN